MVNIENVAECAIRNAMYDMYRNKQHNTLKFLMAVLREREIFVGGQISLWKILDNIGFHYNRDDPKRTLMELPQIVSKTNKLVIRVCLLYVKKNNITYNADMVKFNYLI